MIEASHKQPALLGVSDGTRPARPPGEAMASSYAQQGDLAHALAEAACSRNCVEGLTHAFYRYPARFSPQFARAAVHLFSKPGELVMDPYMGGGTTVVEAMYLGRPVVGNDLNSLAFFVAKVKTTPLSETEIRWLEHWADRCVPGLSYRMPLQDVESYFDQRKMKNLTHIRARFIKKVMAAALASLSDLPTTDARDFARCVVLRVGQWGLDGRGKHTPLADFRAKLAAMAHEMLADLREFMACCGAAQGQELSVHLYNDDAANVAKLPCFANGDRRVSLVVTSPPYPGVHVLYHRWQVNGRRETPAPYWVAGCDDGQGASFYNFGDRRETSGDTYFAASLRTLQAIRQVMVPGAYMVQMVAFSSPGDQLPLYLHNMELAGFSEVFPEGAGGNTMPLRIWRDVPHRKWHAALNGKTHSSREVVLIHRAV